MDPLAILPAEAWLYVIEKLNTHTDTHAAYNTCQLWRGLLKKKRTLWMFEGIFPLLIKHLPKSDILELRLVCKRWKGAIDSHLENDQPTIVAPGRRPFFTRHLPIRTFTVDFWKRAYRLGVERMHVLQRFQSQFETEQASSNNPFVSRSLHLTVTEMNGAIHNFFKTFGVHLFSLQLVWHVVPQRHISPLEIAIFIFDILASIPNIRKLNLKTMQAFEDHQCSRCKIETCELEQFLHHKSAPNLPHLTNLQLDVHPLVRKALESAYVSQLETYAHVRLQKCSPTNLNNIARWDWHFTRGCAVRHLNKLNNPRCQFPQRLHINMRSFKGVHWHDYLYDTLEKIPSSVTHLSLSWESFEAKLPKQLNMPFLQELFLEIGCWNNPRNLNFSFLQKLESLRKLKCAFWRVGFEQLLEFYKSREKPKYQLLEEKVDLQYHLYDDSHGGPYQSNVWQLVPSLDCIEIQVVHYQQPRMISLNSFYTRGLKDKKVAL